MNILKSRSFSIPVISVGNITVGGTGKTPHVEYLIRLLKKHLHVAVLSRGYKRKTKGFLLATKDTPMQDIGDEPYQMKQKFKEIDVAVDSKRTRGIDNITSGDFINKYKLWSASSVVSAAKKKIKKDYITRENNTYYIYDQFFYLWVKKSS